MPHALHCDAEPLVRRARHRNAMHVACFACRLSLSLSPSSAEALQPRHGMNSDCHVLVRSSALVALRRTWPQAQRLILGITVSYSGHSGVSALARGFDALFGLFRQ